MLIEGRIVVSSERRGGEFGVSDRPSAIRWRAQERREGDIEAQAPRAATAIRNGSRRMPS